MDVILPSRQSDRDRDRMGSGSALWIRLIGQNLHMRIAFLDCHFVYIKFYMNFCSPDVIRGRVQVVIWNRKGMRKSRRWRNKLCNSPALGRINYSVTLGRQEEEERWGVEKVAGVKRDP